VADYPACKTKAQSYPEKQSIGEEPSQSQNEIWDGENLSTMVTLYKYRAQVDLILTDPPYNTGEDFRYNDKWDKDPNDPDLGKLVPSDDGSRHSKWLRFIPTCAGSLLVNTDISSPPMQKRKVFSLYGHLKINPPF
jgi:DNA modification methylase